MSPAQSAKALDVDDLRRACSHCSLRDLCLPVGVSASDLEVLDAFVETLGPLHGGDHIFRQGDRFAAIYAVRSGCIKSYAYSEDGEEQVLGFHLPGELVGLDAIHQGLHQCSAAALNTTMVCRLPFDDLSRLTRKIPSLQRQLLRLMSRDIGNSHSLSRKRSAEERMAAFLLGFGERMRTRGFSASHFVLPMSRLDIAKYLDLAPETVSRVLARFESRGLIEFSRREIRLGNRLGLERFCPRDFRL